MLDTGRYVFGDFYFPSHLISVEGYAVDRIREYYYFALGARLGRITDLAEGVRLQEAIRILYPIGQLLNKLNLEQYVSLPMCADAGIKLSQILSDIWPKEESAIDRPLTKIEITKLDIAGRAFDTALSIQLDHLDTYRVTAKGTHDTRKLIEMPEITFGDDWRHLFDLCQKDWASASRCMAFDLCTACGFHAIRAMEAQVVGYLKKRSVTPTKRDLGHYVELMKKEDTAKDATGIVDHIRANHRNPLMHPEDTLELSEALAIFDLTKAAIIYLIQDMKIKGMVQ
jgi:hypothetical protein